MKIDSTYKLLSKSSNSLSARVLLKFLLSKNDVYLMNNPNKELGIWKTIKVKYWEKLLSKGMPVSKITHQKDFYGNTFFTNKNVLCPRPDTETMIDFILEKYDKTFSGNIIDLGTGSGCILLSLLKLYPKMKGTGIDISNSALKVAKKNCKILGLETKAKFIKSDIKKISEIGQYDLIVSNPPYIPKNDSRVNLGAKFDPKIALYGGDDGLDFYRVIAQKGRKILKSDGKIFLEIGVGQTTAVKQIFQQQKWLFCGTKKDLNKINRILIFSKK